MKCKDWILHYMRNYLYLYFNCIICEYKHKIMTPMLLAAYPPNCLNCTYSSENNRTECSLCKGGFSVTDDDKTCAGNSIILYSSVFVHLMNQGAIFMMCSFHRKTNADV